MSDKTPKAPRPVIDQTAVEAPGEPAAAAAAEAASRAASDPSGQVPTASSETRASGGFQDTTWGFIEGAGKRAWAYADAHPHTVLYGAIGLVLAVLILALGLWRTIVIAVFVGVGAGIGQLRDGRGGLHSVFGRIFGGR